MKKQKATPVPPLSGPTAATIPWSCVVCGAVAGPFWCFFCRRFFCEPCAFKHFYSPTECKIVNGWCKKHKRNETECLRAKAWTAQMMAERLAIVLKNINQHSEKASEALRIFDDVMAGRLQGPIHESRQR